MSAMPAALADVRVLELGSAATQYCGRLLTDLGADVVVVEPPEGSAVRRAQPQRAAAPGPDASLSFWHYNRGKRGVVLDLDLAADQAALRELAAEADVVLEGFAPGHLDRRELGYETLSQASPALIVCSMTGFGQQGPWSGHAGSDLVHLALGGVMASCGYDNIPDAPPIAPSGGQAWHIAGVYAAMSIVVALWHRTQTGLGQHIDLAIHDTVATTTEHAIPFYLYQSAVVHRQTARHALPSPTPPQLFRTRDGRLIDAMLLYIQPHQWAALLDWLDEAGCVSDLRDPIYLDVAAYNARMPHVHEIVAAFIGDRDLEQLYRDAQARRLPWAPVRGTEDLLDDAHFVVDRAFFTAVEHDGIDTAPVYVGPLVRLAGDVPATASRAPRLGEHDEQLAARELWRRPPAPTASGDTSQNEERK